MHHDHAFSRLTVSTAFACPQSLPGPTAYSGKVSDVQPKRLLWEHGIPMCPKAQPLVAYFRPSIVEEITRTVAMTPTVLIPEAIVLVPPTGLFEQPVLVVVFGERLWRMPFS